jgi:large subunit ribosomal protein L18
MKVEKKIKNRKKRHLRVRKKISGTAERPRISIFKSNKHTYVQAIDDEKMISLCGMSDLKIATKGTKTEKAFNLGKSFANLLKKKKIKVAVFDRGGYKYHGRVKAVADGLREAGIKI